MPTHISKSPARIATIMDAATSKGCSPRTIRRYISEGRLTGYRFGPRFIRIDLDELDAMLSPIPTAEAI